MRMLQEGQSRIVALEEEIAKLREVLLSSADALSAAKNEGYSDGQWDGRADAKMHRREVEEWEAKRDAVLARKEGQ